MANLERQDYILVDSTALVDLKQLCLGKMLEVIQNSLDHWPLSKFWLKVVDGTFQVFLKNVT